MKKIIQKVQVFDRFKPPLPENLLEVYKFKHIKIGSKKTMTKFFEILLQNQFIESIIIDYKLRDHTGFALQSLGFFNKLRDFRLYDCSKITTFSWLSAFLKGSLNTLQLYNVSNRSNAKFLEVLTNNEIKLKELGFTGVDFSNNGWIDVFSKMQVHSLTLTDQKNILTIKSMQNIFKGLANNKYIKELQLKWIDLGSLHWLKMVSSFISVNNSLETLTICHAKMNDFGFKFLEKGLYLNQSLEHLNISGNPITSKTLKKISLLIKKKKYKTINVQFNERPVENKIILVKSILDLIYSASTSTLESLDCVPFFVSQTERISLTQYLQFALEMNKLKKENELLKKENGELRKVNEKYVPQT